MGINEWVERGTEKLNEIREKKGRTRTIIKGRDVGTDKKVRKRIDEGGTDKIGKERDGLKEGRKRW